jgi:putative NIF3 family GTP cyclohydrolase 1 type 2
MFAKDRLVLGLVGLSLCAVPLGAQPHRITAKEVIERIQKNVGVPWRTETIDGFKAGSPDTPVTGIATTMMATWDVLHRAAASGKNLIITHEPTFYDHYDKAPALERANDPVLAAKQAFIREHNLVVWRFHDHWHMRRPDGITTGVVRWMGWEKTLVPDSGNRLRLPETTVGAVASEVKSKLKASGVRIVGDPQMKVTKAALVLGAAPSGMQMQALERDDVDLEIIGETREWETVEYVRDAAAQGKHKALIIIGHVPSEQPGMDECARWLKTFVPEVPVEFVPATDPFTLAK